MKLKILQVGKFYHPFHGGIETALKMTAEGLVERGHEVTVLCSAHANSSRVQEEIRGVRVIRAWRGATLLSQPISPGILPRMLKSAPDFDVVHLHSPNPMAELFALALPRTVPLVVTFHSDIVRQRLALLAYRPFLRKFLRRVNSIIAPTDWHIDQSKFLPDFREKIRVIPFGMKPGNFAESPILKKKSEAYKAQFGKFALFVGRLVPYKGCRYLIEAMKNVSTGSVVVVGEGPLHQELLLLCDSLGLKHRIHFLNRVEDLQDLQALYLACNHFVLPSIDRSEAFGLVLLEAMAYAKPLVTTRIPSGVRFVNEEECTGIHVEPGDSEGLGVALNRLFEDDALNARMGKAARARFETVFSFERMLDQYEELYRSLPLRHCLVNKRC